MSDFPSMQSVPFSIVSNMFIQKPTDMLFMQDIGSLVSTYFLEMEAVLCGERNVPYLNPPKVTSMPLSSFALRLRVY